MEMEMVDWWTAPGRTWGVKNLDFKVELTPDRLPRMADFDCYTDADIDAWYDGHWRFITARVVPVDGNLVDHVEAQASLGCIEWGQMPEATLDRDDLMEDPIKGLAKEAVRTMIETGFSLDTETWSDFAPERLKAPF
ncbi:hypothetical protein [Streptomyces cucumeris]|uniref:hypothetical protein n=1 Tax=Streptomyces cucumeris TaxID=2962890 RepID=UPI0020C8987A|nr:hypothetical protein [Streptomyces sp. NEAU-Y11]MCP9209579.1 hypothetical protein [Streptomyces sp. NEAU-Y11]